MSYLIEDIYNTPYLDEGDINHWNVMLSMTLNNTDSFSINIFIKRDYVDNYKELLKDLNLKITDPCMSVEDIRSDQYLHIFLVNFKDRGIESVSANVHDENWIINFIVYLKRKREDEVDVRFYLEAPADDIMDIVRDHRFIIKTEEIDPTYEQRRPKGHYCMNI